LFWRKHAVLGNKTAMNRSQLYAKTWNQAAHFELEYAIVYKIKKDDSVTNIGLSMVSFLLLSKT
jgi:hypothetical protein